jgi:DNA-binding MarR family transcriptional regulator
MNEQLGVLVAHGYLERKPHPTHGRIVRMRLTAAGRKVLAKATALAERTSEKMLSGLTADEQRRFARYLERCATALEPTTAEEFSA